MGIQNKLLLALCSLLTLVSTTRGYASSANGWGARESFAVVAPVSRTSNAQTLSLSGEWGFINDKAELYRLSVGDGVWGPSSYDWEHARKLQVPGIWEAQGVGEPAPGRTWDPSWDCGMWDLNNVYVGRALYRRTFTLPSHWEGDRVWLKVGGVGSQAYIWINGKRAAFVETYCGARKYDVTDLVDRSGVNEITALVRNDVPSRLGLLAVNEHFGGFFRDVEIEMTPDVYIDDVWVRGDVASGSADVSVYIKQIDDKGVPYPTYDDELSPNDRDMLAELRANGVKLSGETEKDLHAEVLVTIDTLDHKVVGQQKLEAKLEIGENGLAKPLRFNIPIENCKLWTPEEPNLYIASVFVFQAADKKGATPKMHSWSERFGVREFKVVGDQFYLNGKPYFLRGGGDHNYDQIDLIEPADRDRFLEHMTTYKEAGFNYMRFHTHCPLPEYFEAADEKGILLQPELPYYHDVPCEGFAFDPKRDIYELFRTNRRYVSFATYSFGNEGYLGDPIAEELYSWVKTYDPDRLVIHEDGGPGNRPGTADYTTNGSNGVSIINPWQVGAHDDLRVPFVAHEYLNLAIKMDPRYESRFTGVRKAPVQVKPWIEKLEKLGLTERWGEACIAASERLQAIYQKRGLESARLDPACDGYLFWSLVDASIPQGSCVAAQGYLNPFWEPRPNGNSPKMFYRFNGPTALLVTTDLDAPILTAGQTFNAEIKISHYDSKPIRAQKLFWYLRRVGEKSALYSGEIELDEIQPGYAGKLTDVKIAVPETLEEPIAAELVVELANGRYINSWNYWLFPKREKQSLKGFAVSKSLYERFEQLYADVKPIDASADATDGDIWIVTPSDSEYYVGLSTGRKVFSISPASQTPNVSLGWWSLGTQVGTTFAASNAFAKFPNNLYMNELWFRLIREGAPDLATAPLGAGYEPLAVGEGRDSYYLYLGQTRFGKGKLLQSYAIDLLQDKPEATALLDSLLAYVKSDDFDPTASADALNFTTYKAPAGVTWGYSKLVATNQATFATWKTLYEDSVVHLNCRQTSKEMELSWLTEPVKFEEGSDFTTLAFVGGLGYWSESQTDGFTLNVNDEQVLKFDLPAEKTKVGDKIEWKSENGVSMTFDVGRVELPGPDFFGVFYLTIPNKLIGKEGAVKLSVGSLGENSLRWFSVSEYAGIKQVEKLQTK